MDTDLPDFSFIIRDNESSAAQAIADGRNLDAFLVLHTLIESLLRVFLRIEKEHVSFDHLIKRYLSFLEEEDYPNPEFVDELHQFNRRRNRMVHQLWKKGYSYTNNHAEEAAKAAVMLYGLFIEWLETFDPGITTVGFHYET